MSGHSKWSQIKRKKEATDAKKGQAFTRVAREITIAARAGGGDPNANFALRLAIEKARAVNMPKENIERAIKRGTGELKGEVIEEITYEGYGPHGIALLVQVVTDNRNRAVSEIRRLFNRHGGTLGSSGSVAWLFDQKGVIIVAPDGRDPEELGLLAIEAGADDITIDDAVVEVYTDPASFPRVRQALEANNIRPDNAEVALVPKSRVSLSPEDTLQVMKLIESLEELDDVARVYSNLEVSEEAVARYETAA